MTISTFSVHQEKVIPSVVIEPASNHEGEGEHHETTVGATEDVAPQGQAGETQELVAEAMPLDSQAAAAAPGGAGDSSVSAEDAAQDMPPGFLYKVFILSRQGHCRFFEFPLHHFVVSQYAICIVYSFSNLFSFHPDLPWENRSMSLFWASMQYFNTLRTSK